MKTSKNIGWICPKCDAAVAPTVKVCPNCVSAAPVGTPPKPNKFNTPKKPLYEPTPMPPRIKIPTPPAPGEPPKIYGQFSIDRTYA